MKQKEDTAHNETGWMEYEVPCVKPCQRARPRSIALHLSKEVAKEATLLFLEQALLFQSGHLAGEEPVLLRVQERLLSKHPFAAPKLPVLAKLSIHQVVARLLQVEGRLKLALDEAAQRGVLTGLHVHVRVQQDDQRAHAEALVQRLHLLERRCARCRDHEHLRGAGNAIQRIARTRVLRSRLHRRCRSYQRASEVCHVSLPGRA
eukprot:scaffold535_cov260-Pinguiococcus_pyrenoidosus.AAC.42